MIKLTAKLAAAVLLSALILLVVPQAATAGTEPSPFKDQVDALTIHVKDLRLQIEERLSIPPDDLRDAVAEIHRVAGAIMDLNIFSNQIAIDFILCPGCEVMGIEPSPFKGLKRQVKKLIASIDEFLALAIPGEIIAAAEFIGATQNLRTQSVLMKKDVKGIIAIIEEANGCSENADCGCSGELVPCSAFTTETDCSFQYGCNWIDDGTAPGYCAPTDVIITQCSDISFEQCDNRDGCYTRSCVDGLCQ
jgi:hypothetical protein